MMSLNQRWQMLKTILVKKLSTLTEGKVSQGVKDYLGTEVIAKGSKFSILFFETLDFTSIQLSNWTSICIQME
jgi:DNA-directed RNA polymerase subunit beta